MGERGPVPKRSTQRRRTNITPGIEGMVTSALGAETVEQPDESPEWHPVARMIWGSLGDSGQSRFYEASDWAVAYLICESISMDLRPQYLGVTAAPHSEPVYGVIPLKGASLSSYLKAFASLMMTEGDRRRLHLELERGEATNPDGDRADATVTELFALVSGG